MKTPADLTNRKGCAAHKECCQVILISGAESCTWSEEYRAECDAYRVLSLPTLADRRRELDEIERKRGAKGRNALEGLMTMMHSRRRA